MNRVHTIRQGDTFTRIARQYFGDPTRAADIAAANPGANEPLQVGQTLMVPLGGTAGGTPGAELDEVAISVNGQRFSQWTRLELHRAMDAVSTVEFEAPWDVPSSPEVRSVFQPFSYQPVDLLLGGQRVFTGTEVGVQPDVQIDRKTIRASCYALCGVLNDCTPPASAFPLEFYDAGFMTIARRVLAPFGLTASSQLSDLGTTFEQVDLSRGRRVWSFLVQLAKQRNLILTNDAEGQLVVTRGEGIGEPVARLLEGQPPVMQVSPTFDPRNYYSAITGIEPVVVGLSGSTYSVKNARLQGAVRPFVFQTPDTPTGDVQTATEQKAGAMFASAVRYTVNLASWRDPSDRLWEPGRFVTLYAPGAMVYNEYKFLIRGVTLTATADQRVAQLDLVLPGSMSGRIPERVPWADE